MSSVLEFPTWIPPGEFAFTAPAQSCLNHGHNAFIDCRNKDARRDGDTGMRFAMCKYTQLICFKPGFNGEAGEVRKPEISSGSRTSVPDHVIETSCVTSLCSIELIALPELPSDTGVYLLKE